MATFGWAYINCADASSTGSGSSGPAYSLQFVTESGGATTGSALFSYYTASQYGYDPSTAVLSGNLIVTGAISASVYHIEDIAVIDATGSTTFGNTNDDEHHRTGSFVVIGRNIAPSAYTLSASVVDGRTSVRGFSGRYRRITANGTIATDEYIIGCSGSANQTLYLPSASAAGAGALLIVKDEYLNRASTAVYISASVPAGGFKIESDAYYILTGTMPAVNMYSDGSNWFVF